ncbi:MAG: AMP phosphorylase [archaeon]
MKYIKKMTAKNFDIEAGKMVSILCEHDAKELGIMPLDRIEIRNPENNKRIVTVADTTDSMLTCGQIGLFEDVTRVLKVRKNGLLEVNAVPRPESVNYIKNKLRGDKLTKKEILEIVKGIESNTLSEVEVSAFMASVFIHGFDLEETTFMTKALIETGEKLKINKKLVVDKHSVGGINGRATMIVVPIIAANGLFIPKTSSRSITSAAGTADAMEVLCPVNLSMKKIKSITEKIGGVITWGGAINLAPADDKIIKIEHPLSLDPEGQVIASVLAKKASVGAKIVAIGIPVGPETKVKTMNKARDMAKKFVTVGKKLGMKVHVEIIDASEPSGLAFGPALEAKYVLEILEGKFYDNLAEKACSIAGKLLEMSGKTKKGQGKQLAIQTLKNGKALKKMLEIIKAQSGKIKNSKQVKLSSLTHTITAKQSGMIYNENIYKIVEIARTAGAPADHQAGVMLHFKEGQKVLKGEKLFTIYSENKVKLELAVKKALSLKPVEYKKTIIEEVV